MGRIGNASQHPVTLQGAEVDPQGVKAAAYFGNSLIV